MQQYFIKGRVENPVTIKRQGYCKHMFNVMRLTGWSGCLGFEDSIKRLARVTDRENRVFEVIEDLNDNVEMPVSVTIASMAFPREISWIWWHKRQQSLELRLSGAFLPTGLWVKWDGKRLTKEDKLAKIALGAAEQSRRDRVPEVRLFEKEGEFLSELDNFDKIFITYEEAAKAGELATLARELAKVESGQKILFIFGPEGGISPSEIDAFEEAGGLKIGLGPRIMRTKRLLSTLWVVSVMP